MEFIDLPIITAFFLGLERSIKYEQNVNKIDRTAMKTRKLTLRIENHH